ncbi:hypothetical protein G7046_g9617 [Stylonectria norvegica]|nr:hypothetical protein G7046_g9617 [Stylonectria norvegica]
MKRTSQARLAHHVELIRLADHCLCTLTMAASVFQRNNDSCFIAQEMLPQLALAWLVSLARRVVGSRGVIASGRRRARVYDGARNTHALVVGDARSSPEVQRRKRRSRRLELGRPQREPAFRFGPKDASRIDGRLNLVMAALDMVGSSRWWSVVHRWNLSVFDTNPPLLLLVGVSHKLGIPRGNPACPLEVLAILERTKILFGRYACTCTSMIPAGRPPRTFLPRLRDSGSGPGRRTWPPVIFTPHGPTSGNGLQVVRPPALRGRASGWQGFITYMQAPAWFCDCFLLQLLDASGPVLISTHDETPELQTPTSSKLATCIHREVPATSPCLDCKAEKTRARKYRWTLILGLVWPFALGALDATIIASALPWIAGDFGQISQLNWITSAFNLTAAAFIPFWAQAADVFGRNASLNAAIIFMLIGGALCTGAPTNAFPVLLLGRGFQGVAAAGINVITRTILADKVSLQENAKNWAIFSLVGGFSYALGPVIGGYLTRASWRWCFAINLPIGVVALVVTFFMLRKILLGPQPIPELNETPETGSRTKLTARIKTIDAGGQLLFIFGFGLIILALTWGGASYPWDSAAVIVPLIFGLAFSAMFLYYEYLMGPGNALAIRMPWQRAMIPWALISHRDIGLLFYCECITGMGMYAVLYFCNIYFIAVKGDSSDKAGLYLLYFTPGLGVGVFLCSFICNTWPRMTFPSIFFGTIIELVGIGLLAWSMYADRSATVFGMMAMVGCGCGMRFMASPLHGIALFKAHRASVIALMAVAVPFGGTIGLTIMASVFNNTSGLDSHHSDFSQIQSQPADERVQAIHGARMGVVWAFVAVTPFVALAVLCASCLGNIKLGQGPPGEDGPTNVVIKGSYLLSLLRNQSVPNEEKESTSRPIAEGLTTLGGLVYAEDELAPVFGVLLFSSPPPPSLPSVGSLPPVDPSSFESPETMIHLLLDQHVSTEFPQMGEEVVRMPYKELSIQGLALADEAVRIPYEFVYPKTRDKVVRGPNSRPLQIRPIHEFWTFKPVRLLSTLSMPNLRLAGLDAFEL